MLGSEAVRMRIRTYGFARCFTRPPGTSARNHRREVDHVEAMSSPCRFALQSSPPRAHGWTAGGWVVVGVVVVVVGVVVVAVGAVVVSVGVVAVAVGAGTMTVRVLTVTVFVGAVVVRVGCLCSCPPKSVVLRPPPDAAR